MAEDVPWSSPSSPNLTKSLRIPKSKKSNRAEMTGERKGNCDDGVTAVSTSKNPGKSKVAEDVSWSSPSSPNLTKSLQIPKSNKRNRAEMTGERKGNCDMRSTSAAATLNGSDSNSKKKGSSRGKRAAGAERRSAIKRMKIWKRRTVTSWFKIRSIIMQANREARIRSFQALKINEVVKEEFKIYYYSHEHIVFGRKGRFQSGQKAKGKRLPHVNDDKKQPRPNCVYWVSNCKQVDKIVVPKGTIARVKCSGSLPEVERQCIFYAATVRRMQYRDSAPQKCEFIPGFGSRRLSQWFMRSN